MIPKTKLHFQRLVDQVTSNFVNLQNDLIRNANSHKTMALAQSPDVKTLASFVTDCIGQYSMRLNWVKSLRDTTTKRQDFINILTTIGWAETDVVNVYTPINQLITTIQAMPLTSYSEIIAVCDTILSTIDKPLSLWEE